MFFFKSTFFKRKKNSNYSKTEKMVRHMTNIPNYHLKVKESLGNQAYINNHIFGHIICNECITWLILSHEFLPVCADPLTGEREREMFYLTTHSTHFIYSYMVSDI